MRTWARFSFVCTVAVFFGHQIASFLGVRRGGYFFDITEACMPACWAGVAPRVVTPPVHLSIRDEVPAPMAEAA